jgi:hypothetical protein
MASSFFGFYAHAGACRALVEAGLAPARVCGSSSGSIIAALYAGGLDPRTTLPALLHKLKQTDILTPWWRAPTLGLGFFQINQAFLEAASPITRLEDGVCPVAISTFDVLSRRTIVWSTGPAHAVVAASCAIPGFMQPVRLDGRVHVDGGVADLLGLASCKSDERVLSVDLFTQGLMGMRAWHVKLLGARPAAADAASGSLAGCTRLQLRGLPFLGPTTMEQRAAEAMEAGRAAMQAALLVRGTFGGERIVAVDVPVQAVPATDAVPQ